MTPDSRVATAATRPLLFAVFSIGVSYGFQEVWQTMAQSATAMSAVGRQSSVVSRQSRIKRLDGGSQARMNDDSW
jgi:hypothetical protein